MPTFCGAWAPEGGAPLARLLPPERRATMERFLDGERRTHTGVTLWVVARPDGLAAEGGTCLVEEGVLGWGPDADSGAALRRQRDEREPRLAPEGHFALAFADAKRLILLRDTSGAERLYYAELDGLVLFANTLKPLLAHPSIGRRLDAESAAQWFAHGAVQLGDGTLFEGIREVPPGETVAFTRDRRSVRRHWPDTAAPDGPPPSSESLRRALSDAVSLAIGRDGRVAVALSGGIDSATVAALAVERLGSKNVHAFTYDFEHPEHPSEVDAAARTCRRLGIAHETVRFTYADFRGAVPETIWRMEEGFLGRALSLIFARWVARRGFPKTLAGQGMEALLGQVRDEPLDRLARLLPALPCPERFLRHWKLTFLLQGRCRTIYRTLAGLPGAGFKPPLLAHYFVALAVLRHGGGLRDASGLYPAGLRELLEPSLESERVREAIAAVKNLPLAVQLQYAVRHWNRTYFLRGRTALTRGGGSRFIFPAALTPPAWSARHLWTRPQPGRALLARAMSGSLPEAVLTRPKVWATREPPDWDRRLAADLRPLAGRSLDAVDALLSGRLGRASRFLTHEPGPRSWESVDGPYGFLNPVSLGLWHRLFVASPPAENPPSWDELAAQRP